MILPFTLAVVLSFYKSFKGCGQRGEDFAQQMRSMCCSRTMLKRTNLSGAFIFESIFTSSRLDSPVLLFYKVHRPVQRLSYTATLPIVALVLGTPILRKFKADI